MLGAATMAACSDDDSAFGRRGTLGSPSLISGPFRDCGGGGFGEYRMTAGVYQSVQHGQRTGTRRRVRDAYWAALDLVGSAADGEARLRTLVGELEPKSCSTRT